MKYAQKRNNDYIKRNCRIEESLRSCRIYINLPVDFLLKLGFYSVDLLNKFNFNFLNFNFKVNFFTYSTYSLLPLLLQMMLINLVLNYIIKIIRSFFII